MKLYSSLSSHKNPAKSANMLMSLAIYCHETPHNIFIETSLVCACKYVVAGFHR